MNNLDSTSVTENWPGDKSDRLAITEEGEP